MRLSILLLMISFSAASCAQKNKNTNSIPLGIHEKTSAHEAVATFAEGCFWHTEIVFQSLQGVRDAVSGYAGGSSRNPNYSTVSDGNTGYAESVNVYYDPSVISFETLVKAFFASHDPTQVNRQGPDVGTQYRSIVFYRNEKEKEIIQQELNRVKHSGKYNLPIATDVKQFTSFYPAEAYHQEYIYNHPDNPYVQHVSIPDYLRFRKDFKGKFKD